MYIYIYIEREREILGVNMCIYIYIYIQIYTGAAYVEYDDKRDAEDAARSLKKGKICGKDVEVSRRAQGLGF